MESGNSTAEPRYRVWLVRCDDGRPRQWHDLPARALAVRPLDDLDHDSAAAAALIEGFNQAMLDSHGAMLDRGEAYWAVAAPVSLRYEGDLQRGAAVDPSRLAQWPAAAGAASD